MNIRTIEELNKATRINEKYLQLDWAYCSSCRKHYYSCMNYTGTFYCPRCKGSYTAFFYRNKERYDRIAGFIDVAYKSGHWVISRRVSFHENWAFRRK